METKPGMEFRNETDMGFVAEMESGTEPETRPETMLSPEKERETELGTTESGTE